LKHGGKKPAPGLPFLIDEAADALTREELAGADVGDYRLLKRLATGGMSEVWLADADAGPMQGKQVVVKRLLPKLRQAADCVQRFRAEAELGAQLMHDNLARTFGLIEEGDDLYLAQELVGGETLSLLAAAPPGCRA
jgi:serine/threonine-protein kinase